MVNLVDCEQHRISNPAFDHSSIAVDPSGEWIATVTGSDDDHDLTGVDHIWVARIDGSEPQQVTTVAGWWDNLCWHPEGALLALGATNADRIGFSHLYRFDRDDRGVWSEPSRLGDTDINVDPLGGGDLVPVVGAVLEPGTTNGATVIDRHPLDGSTPDRIHDDRTVVGGFDGSFDGSRLFAGITSPADLWDLSGDEPG